MRVAPSSSSLRGSGGRADPPACIYALGTTPKAKADDYDAHAKSGGIEIGAEYMVHSFSRGEAMYIARDFLTVEVALYLPKDAQDKAKPLDINYGDFQLTINGKKIALMPMNPYTVATTLDHPDWQQERPGIEATAGTPNGRVTSARLRTRHFPLAIRRVIRVPLRFPSQIRPAESSGNRAHQHRRSPWNVRCPMVRSARPSPAFSISPTAVM